jgi:hypothetical protein
MATSRNEAFRIQALQLTDALLVWLAFWFGWEMRDFVRLAIGMEIESAEARESINWVLYIAVPFTPLVLERFGFYDHLRTKTTGRAIVQLIQGLILATKIP